MTTQMPAAKWKVGTAWAPEICVRPNAPIGACTSAYFAALEAELSDDGVNTGLLGTFIQAIAGWYKRHQQ